MASDRTLMSKRDPDYWVKSLLQKLGVVADTLTPRWSYPPRRTTQLYYEAFHTSPRLDALFMLSQDAASVPGKVYDKKAYRIDKDNTDAMIGHPLLDLLDNPMPDHPEMDGFMLKQLTYIYRKLIGEAFWLMETDNRGIPHEAYPVPPNWVLQTPTTNVPYFLIVPLGNTSHKPLTVAPKDVIWFKDADITSPFGRGRARTEAIGDEIESDEYASKYGKNYFYNDATPPLVIEAPGATPDTVEQLRETWYQRIGGVLNARKPMFLPWKDTKITKLADSVREMDFVESRKFLRDVCNQHWALPPELTGILENSNRSTIDSAYYFWTKNVISKETARFDAAINRQLVPKFDAGLIYVSDNVVPEDAAFDLQVATTGLSAGAVTVDEWRTKNGMKPLPEGKGGVLLRGFNVVEVPINGKPPAPAPAEEAIVEEPKIEPVTEPVPLDNVREPQSELGIPVEPGEPGKRTMTEAEAKALSHFMDVFEPKQKFKALSKDQRKAVWKSFDAKARKNELPFILAVKRFSAEQRVKAKSSVHVATMDNDLDAMFTTALDKAVVKALLPAWKLSAKSGFDHASEVMGKSYKKDVTSTWDIVNEEFDKWIEENGLLKAEGINDVTEEKLRKKLAATVQEGIDAGEGRGKLSNRVLDVCDEVYDEMDRTRANLIARTETCATVNFGQTQTYKADGVEKKEWLATQDDRTRDDHADADGQVVGIDEDFEVGGDSMSAPGLGSDASENCNCRCTILPVIPEEGE